MSATRQSDPSDDTKNSVIESETELNKLMGSFQFVNDEIRRLKQQSSGARECQLSTSRELAEERITDKAEELEIQEHSAGVESMENYSKQLKIFEKRKSDILAEIKQLQSEIEETKLETNGSPILNEIQTLRERMDSLETALERKICTPGETSVPIMQLLEKVVCLTNERERAMRSIAIRGRLRKRLSVLREKESQYLQKTAAVGPNYEASAKEYLTKRDQYLREANTLREGNEHLSHLVRNIKLSRDGECDRASALPRDEALSFAQNSDRACEELRLRIAAACEKKEHLLKKLETVNNKGNKTIAKLSEDSKMLQKDTELLKQELVSVQQNAKQLRFHQ